MDQWKYVDSLAASHCIIKFRVLQGFLLIELRIQLNFSFFHLFFFVIQFRRNFVLPFFVKVCLKHFIASLRSFIFWANCDCACRGVSSLHYLLSFISSFVKIHTAIRNQSLFSFFSVFFPSIFFSFCCVVVFFMRFGKLLRLFFQTFFQSHYFRSRFIGPLRSIFICCDSLSILLYFVSIFR